MGLTPYPPMHDGLDAIPPAIVVSPAIYAELCCALYSTNTGLTGVIESRPGVDGRGGYDLYINDVLIEMDPL